MSTLTDETWTARRQAALSLIEGFKTLQIEAENSPESAPEFDPVDLLAPRAKSVVRAELIRILDRLAPILNEREIECAACMLETD